MEAETKYREARKRRAVSEARRQIAREILAEALNRPGMPPVTLVDPPLPHINRELPEVEGLIKDALSNDPAILALCANVEAARERLKAARADGILFCLLNLRHLFMSGNSDRGTGCAQD